MTVKIITDSTSYIDERLRAKLDIKVAFICFLSRCKYERNGNKK